MVILVKDAVGVSQSIKTIDDLLDDAGVVDESNPLHTTLVSGSAHVGRVGGSTYRPSYSFTRPSDATAYAAGDVVANSMTQADVEPLVFEVARVTSGSGRITGATIMLGAGALPMPRLQLYLFLPQGPDIPYSAGSYLPDNDDWVITTTQLAQLVSVIEFSEYRWLDKKGGPASSDTGPYWQAAPTSPRQFDPFDLDSLGVNYLRGILRVQSAWDPGAVGVAISIKLDVDQD